MVLNGLINTRILAICRDLNIDAVGISGVDAGLVRAHKRAPVKLDDGSERTIDYGFVGDVDAVDAAVLLKLLDNGLMPVVSPLSADENGVLLNINADTVAAAIGAAVQAEKLILCTGGARHPRECHRSGIAHLLHRPCRFAAAARGGCLARWHAAEGEGD